MRTTTTTNCQPWKDTIFLGHDWLEKHNPTIDWQKGIVTFNRCPLQCQERKEKETKEGKKIWQELKTKIRALTNISTELAAKAKQKKAEVQLPEQCKEFADVRQRSI